MKNKNKTIIGNNSFIGSNSTIVAPIKIGNDVVLGAGSTFNKTVPDNTLSIGRAHQINKSRKKNPKIKTNRVKVRKSLTARLLKDMKKLMDFLLFIGIRKKIKYISQLLQTNLIKFI